MSSKNAMMSSWKGEAFPRTAPIVMRTAAAAKSDPTKLHIEGEKEWRREDEQTVYTIFYIVDEAQQEAFLSVLTKKVNKVRVAVG